MHAIILCGAFDPIEPTKTPRELMELYHYLRRVQKLKIGRDKHGEDLLKAVDEYRATKEPLNVPEVYEDDVELEVKRLTLLPIYRLDIHDHFRGLMQAKRFMYDPKGSITAWHENQSVRVLRSIHDIQGFVSSAAKDTPCGWAGLLQKCEEFRYTDKKTNQQVAALKMYLTNDGDTMECVMWPRLYKDSGAPKPNKIIFVKGIIKESREPGKWSLSAMSVVQI